MTDPYDILMRDSVKKFHTFAEKEFIRKNYPELTIANCTLCRCELLVEADNLKDGAYYICEICGSTTLNNN